MSARGVGEGWGMVRRSERDHARGGGVTGAAHLNCIFFGLASEENAGRAEMSEARGILNDVGDLCDVSVEHEEGGHGGHCGYIQHLRGASD